MAEQDQVNQGAIPPKVSPLDKPEGQAAVTPAGAAANAPRPITVRLKPAAPASSAPAAPAPAAAPQPPRTIDPKATSRIPVPEEVAAAAAPPAAIRPATVRLRPVAPSGAATPAVTPQTVPGSTQAITQVELSSTAPIAPVVPVQPQPQPPPTPGASPLPDGPKPLSAAQVQAAKSKTSRISLDAAIGVAPAESVGPKTIRLKRPSDLTAPPAAPTVASVPLSPASARKTSRIPDAAVPSAEGDGGAGVTQKKTLKIKRPGKSDDAADAAGTEGEGFPDGVQMTPISPLDFPVQREESSVFTTFAAICAIAAAVVLVLLTLCLGAHAIGRDAGRNALASISGPELPWPGRIAN